jgi:hypothetical protein
MTEKKTDKKMGRPSLDPQRVRCVSLLVRITKAEKELFTSKAKAKGEKLSEWVRERLLA